MRAPLEDFYKGGTVRANVRRRVVCRGCRGHEAHPRCSSCSRSCPAETKVVQRRMGPMLINEEVQVPSEQLCREEVKTLHAVIERGAEEDTAASPLPIFPPYLPHIPPPRRRGRHGGHVRALVGAVAGRGAISGGDCPRSWCTGRGAGSERSSGGAERVAWRDATGGHTVAASSEYRARALLEGLSAEMTRDDPSLAAVAVGRGDHPRSPESLRA